MNILTYNKEMKEKIKKILNEKKNEKREPTKVDLEIQIEKKYANNEEHKYIIEDLANLIFGQNIGIYKFLEIESFLLGENSDDFLTKNLLEILNNSMKENHKENIENHKISKIMFLLTLIIIIISFFGHYNNWSYSFWNKNIFLLVLNVILVIVAIIITLVTYIFLYEINKYNKRYNLKRNNFFEISLGITLLIIGAMHFYFKSFGNTDYSNGYKEVSSYSQPQAQQEEVKSTVVENNNINTYIPTVEDARYINYRTYYNDNFDYSIDYPDDDYFQISKTYEDGMKLQNDNGEVLISLTSNWNPNGESLQQAYDKAVREKPNAPYKFLGKTFFTITYEDNGLLVFRKTMYDKNSNKYVYLYVSFPPEYKDYMTPIVERMANSMKKSVSNVTSTPNNSYSESQLENKFGRVVKDKYVGGSFIEFLRNANENEYYYLRDQFWEILDTMYVTEDNKTYYYLNDIIDQLETKADWDNSSRVIFLEVKGNKMYYTVGFPKGYNANTPSWVQFEIFERKFKDGIGLRTAHVSCAINGVEYKDWDAVYAIFR